MTTKIDRFAGIDLGTRKTAKPAAASALTTQVADLSSDAPQCVQMRIYEPHRTSIIDLCMFVARKGRQANRARVIRAAIGLAKSGTAFQSEYTKAEESARVGDAATIFELRLYAPQVEKLAELSASIGTDARSIERQSVIRAAIARAAADDAFLRIYDELSVEDRARISRKKHSYYKLTPTERGRLVSNRTRR